MDILMEEYFTTNTMSITLTNENNKIKLCYLYPAEENATTTRTYICYIC
jgi:hypothetical protein